MKKLTLTLALSALILTLIFLTSPPHQTQASPALYGACYWHTGSNGRAYTDWRSGGSWYNHSTLYVYNGLNSHPKIYSVYYWRDDIQDWWQIPSNGNAMSYSGQPQVQAGNGWWGYDIGTRFIDLNPQWFGNGRWNQDWRWAVYACD
jgi:hypothetical protein